MGNNLNGYRDNALVKRPDTEAPERAGVMSGTVARVPERINDHTTST